MVDCDRQQQPEAATIVHQKTNGDINPSMLSPKLSVEPIIPKKKSKLKEGWIFLRLISWIVNISFRSIERIGTIGNFQGK